MSALSELSGAPPEGAMVDGLPGEWLLPNTFHLSGEPSTPNTV